MSSGGREAKARARAGTRRRKEMKKGLVKRWVYHLGTVAVVLAVEASTYASAGAEKVGKFAERLSGSSRVDVVEFFGGHSEVSYRAAKQGWRALQPFDVKYG